MKQKMLQDMAYKFAKAEFASASQASDKEEKYTAEIRQKAAAQGLVGAWIPEQYGGAGVGILGKRHHHRGALQSGHGDRPQRDGGDLRLRGDLPVRLRGAEADLAPRRSAPGRRWPRAPSRSPNAGTDVAGYKTRAVKDGADYVINGNKMFITNGTVCDFMVTQCITNPEEKKHNSFSLIIVPGRRQGGSPATRSTGSSGSAPATPPRSPWRTCGCRSRTSWAKEGNGFRELMHFFDTTRVMVAAQALGLSEACLETSVKYVKERTAFGQPLGAYQLTQKKLTEMAIQIEALRGLVYKAAWLIDEGRPRLHARGHGEILRRGDRRLLRQLRRRAPRGVRLHRGVPGPEVVPRRQDPGALRGDQGGRDHDDRPLPPDALKTGMKRGGLS